MDLPSWTLPRVHPSLADDEIHIWWVELNVSKEVEQSLSEVLSPDERERADRFYFGRHCRRFVIARGMLRILLAGYLRAEAAKLRFDYGPYGKPAIRNSQGPTLQFNIAHSSDVALYAMSRNRVVGIDVERMRDDIDFIEIALRFFSAFEVRDLCALQNDERKQGFFNCWTRKEAFIKALGKGLNYPLENFDVSLKPGTPAELLRVQSNPVSSEWALQDLYCNSAYAAALAVEGKIGKLKYWHLPSAQLEKHSGEPRILARDG